MMPDYPNHRIETGPGTPASAPCAPETVRCCVVLPAYREAGRIGNVIRKIRPFNEHILVVDDGSDDGTAAEAAEAGAEVIRHETNRGKGAALHTGIHHALRAGHNVFITLDADGQHEPEAIPSFLAAYRRGDYPVLVGSRMNDTATMPWLRKRTNQFMSWLLSRMMGQVVPDTQCGYRLYAAAVVPHIRTRSAGFAAESEQLLYLAEQGIRIGSVPIPTIYGDEKSKINPATDTVRFFRMLWRYRARRRHAR